VKPRLPSKVLPFLEERAGPEIRDQDADDGEQRHVEPDRS